MRRLTWLSLLLLGLDQATKTLAQVLLKGRELLLVDGFGLTYVTNPGLWIWPTVPPAVVLLVHALAVAGWILALSGWRWYRDSLAEASPPH